jgi:hypothetical protein
MKDHEDKMLEEINELHQDLAAAERGRLKWMGISLVCFLVIGVLTWLLIK